MKSFIINEILIFTQKILNSLVFHLYHIHHVNYMQKNLPHFVEILVPTRIK